MFKANLPLAILFSYYVVISPLNGQQLSMEVKAESAILMNADSGTILFSKNPHELHFPASITKIATALYALHAKGTELDVYITANQEAIGWVSEEQKIKSQYTLPSYLLVPGASHIGIKKGETLSLRDLLYGMMVASGDDASNLIAQYVSGSISKFTEEMNDFVRSLGCTQTTFYNPHGLHHPNQQTTAYDMAILTREALKNPTFRELVSTVRYKRPKTNKQEASYLVQGNKLLRTGDFHYPKAIGVKTGYLSLARNTFVAAAKDGDRTLIAVLMKVQDRKDMFLDSIKLFEAAFNQPKVQKILLKSGPQKFEYRASGAKDVLRTYSKEEITLTYYPAEEPPLKALLSWNVGKFPVQKDQIVGDISFVYPDGSLYAKSSLYAREKVEITIQAWMKEIIQESSLLAKGITFSIFVLLVSSIIALRKSR